jgi:hypothetical protein
MAKVIKFSSGEVQNLISVRNIAKSHNNELIVGMIDIILKNRELDCGDRKFRIILDELAHEFSSLKEKAVMDEIKNNPELEKLIVDTNTTIECITNELTNIREGEIPILTYIARLAQYTDEIRSKYPKVFDLTRRKSFMESIRNSKLVRKFLIGAGIISVAGYSLKGSPETNSGLNNPKINSVSSVPYTPSNQNIKAMTWEEMNAANERFNRNMERIKTEGEARKEWHKNYDGLINNRKTTIIKVEKTLSNMKMPTDYITPKHIMALIWQESKFEANAENGIKAFGLMQVMKDSWSLKEKYEDNKGRIEKNIEAGIQILREKEAYCRKNHPNWDKLTNDDKIDILFAAYNCGEGKLDKKYHWNISKSNPETIAHINNIHKFLKYN